MEGIHRHPKERQKSATQKSKRHPKPTNSQSENSSSRPPKARILKIPFHDKASRDHFLYNFRKSVKKFTDIPQTLTVRRDMTKSELHTLYQLRQQAYLSNVADKEFKYIVVDLEIRTLSHPQKLRVKTELINSDSQPLKSG